MTVRLKVKTATPELGLVLECMECGAPLEIHQPDREYPDRILGTCEDCHGWVVADLGPGRGEHVMLFLPGIPLTDGLGIAI